MIVVTSKMNLEAERWGKIEVQIITRSVIAGLCHLQRLRLARISDKKRIEPAEAHAAREERSTAALLLTNLPERVTVRRGLSIATGGAMQLQEQGLLIEVSHFRQRVALSMNRPSN